MTPAAPTAKASASPAGLGLTGMRERAGLLGGVFTAGPNPDRGWSVTATPPRAVSAG